MLFWFITHIEQTGVEQTVAFLALKKWGLFGANENMGAKNRNVCKKQFSFTAANLHDLWSN